MKKMYKKQMTVLFAALLTSNFGSAAATEINELRVEYLKNPVGIDVTQPRFSWKMQSEERGAAQTAYEIVVAPDPSVSTAIWTSGQVASGKSVHILYG